MRFLGIMRADGAGEAFSAGAVGGAGQLGRCGADFAWADGDRAYARSGQLLAADGPEHPNANIAPVLGYADSGDFGWPHNEAVPLATFKIGDAAAFQGVVAPAASLVRLAPVQTGAAPGNGVLVAPIVLGPGGEYVNEEWPGDGERSLLRSDRWLAVFFAVLCVVFLVVCVLMAMGAGTVAGGDRYARLLPAIERVESGGRADAVGDGGRAVGVLQIHPLTVEDANRIAGLRGLGVVFTLEDRKDAGKSREMFRLISDHYSRGAGDEVVARRWNGGPRGDRKAATAAYWAKVRAEMIGGGE